MKPVEKCYVEKCPHIGLNHCNICGHIYCNLELIKNYDNKWRTLNYICISCKLYLEYNHNLHEEMQPHEKKFDACDCKIL